jgi:hypothetical protein
MTNLLQKIILGTGVVVLGAIVLFPHWTLCHPTDPSLIKDGGYAFLLSPPGGVFVPRVNRFELVAFLMITVGLTAAGFWFTRDRE